MVKDGFPKKCWLRMDSLIFHIFKGTRCHKGEYVSCQQARKLRKSSLLTLFIKEGFPQPERPLRMASPSNRDLRKVSLNV